MTINFYLDTRYKKTEMPILIYIRGIGKTLKINTGERILSKHWDSTKQAAKRTYTGHPELNSYLSTLKEKIKKRLRLLNIEHSFITYDMIKIEIEKLFTLSKPRDTKKIFHEAYKQFIEAKKNEKRFRTIQKYQTLLVHLNNFESLKKYQLTFDKINLEFYEKFTSYLMKDLQHSNNTIGKYISCLKTFLHWAVDQNLNNKHDFQKFKVYNDKTDIIVLTEQELMRIYNLDLSNEKILSKVRDVFCFQCFTGQRFSDIESLKREDIKNDIWYLHTYKTRDIIEIPLSFYAKQILNKYKNNNIQPLPILSHQKTNKFIKDVCKLSNIDEPITLVKYRGAERIDKMDSKYKFISTHTARRTFVTISLEKGMRPETIMEITGHTNYKTFRKYIKITSKVKQNEINKYWKKSNLELVKFA